MNTKSPNFPQNLHVEDFLYLIYEQLASIVEKMSPSAPLEVTDIEKLTNAQLDALKVGDAVVKITGNQKHLYLVTYKGEGAGEGIVITCNFCGYSEAISYDRSGEGWVFNSKDVKTYGE